MARKKKDTAFPIVEIPGEVKPKPPSGRLHLGDHLHTYDPQALNDGSPWEAKPFCGQVGRLTRVFVPLDDPALCKVCLAKMNALSAPRSIVGFMEV